MINVQLGASIASIVSAFTMVFAVAWWGSEMNARLTTLEQIVAAHRGIDAHPVMRNEYLKFQVTMDQNLERIRETLADILQAVQVQRTR